MTLGIPFPMIPVAIKAGGDAYMKLRQFGTLKRLNVEHRTPNIEHSILMTLRLIYFKTSGP